MSFSSRITFVVGASAASLIIGGISQFVYKTYFSSRDEQDEYEIIRKYLLNDSLLYGHNKPKLWLHVDELPNARDWNATAWRTSTRINKPYLYSSISSIIQYCSDDFHICLIDNTAFDRLIPGFNNRVVHGGLLDATKANAMGRNAKLCGGKKGACKNTLRDYGIAQLLYYYGGMSIPPSFICMKSLRPLYDKLCSKDTRAFICEIENRVGGLGTLNRNNHGKNAPVTSLTISSDIMGSRKHCETMKQLCEYLCSPAGDIHKWCYTYAASNQLQIIPGELIGTRDINSEPIIMEHLLSSKEACPIAWDPNIYGILYNNQDLEQQCKYDVFLNLSREEWVRNNTHMGYAFCKVANDGVFEMQQQKLQEEETKHSEHTNNVSILNHI